MHAGPVRIEYLADRIEFVPQVGAWLHEEWFESLQHSAEETAAEALARANRERLPLALVAVAGAQAIGMASLLACEKPARAGTGCCLAGVYVLAQWRRQGIGARLCRKATEVAAQLGAPTLCLYTRHHEPFYAALGWNKVADSVLEVGRGFELLAFMEIATAGRTCQI